LCVHLADNFITGTPPQKISRNFYHYSTSVLKYSDLDSLLHKWHSQNTDVEEEASTKVIEALHKIDPSSFYFDESNRTLNYDRAFAEKEINIYVELTEMQRKWYRSILEKVSSSFVRIFSNIKV
jgi:SWI/SNF-related matrix-associated actin-dependent regulator of chromatin subfamily A member 5